MTVKRGGRDRFHSNIYSKTLESKSVDYVREIGLFPMWLVSASALTAHTDILRHVLKYPCVLSVASLSLHISS